MPFVPPASAKPLSAWPALICVLSAVAVGCGRTPEPSESSRSGLAFQDVAPGTGLASFRHENGSEGRFWFPEQMGAGGGFVDYDGDGREDVILVGGGSLSATGPIDVAAVRIFRNSDGSFTEVTEKLGLADVRAYGTGIAAADYDNDGDQDVYVTALGENLLFRNDPTSDGDGRIFVEVGRDAGVALPPVWSSSALFFDTDLDGFVDLYVAGYVDWSPELDVDCYRGGAPDYCPPATYSGAQSYYFHNNGDGTFEEQTAEAGFGGNPGKSLAVGEWDFNQDGFPDIVVVNDGQPDLLYINDGDGTFTERGVLSGIAFGEHGESRAGMGVDIGITDESGQPSIFVGNFSSEMIGVYRRTASGWFVDRAAASHVGRFSLTTLAFGVLLFDADLDTDLDLFVANGHVYLDPIDGSEYRQPPHLFVNNNDGSFTDVADSIGGVFRQAMVARSVSKADYDRDGDLDLLVTENNGPAHLLRNDSGGGKSLRLRLQGKESNRDALGAQLTISIGASRQVQRVRTGSGYLSQSEKTITFGLGTADNVDTLLVVWPSRREEIFTGLSGGVELSLLEGEGVVAQTVLPLAALEGAVSHDTTISSLQPATMARTDQGASSAVFVAGTLE